MSQPCHATLRVSVIWVGDPVNDSSSNPKTSPLVTVVVQVPRLVDPPTVAAVSPGLAAAVIESEFVGSDPAAFHTSSTHVVVASATSVHSRIVPPYGTRTKHVKPASKLATSLPSPNTAVGVLGLRFLIVTPEIFLSELPP